MKGLVVHGILLGLSGSMMYLTYADTSVPKPIYHNFTTIQSTYSSRSGSVGSSFYSGGSGSGGSFRSYGGGK